MRAVIAAVFAVFALPALACAADEKPKVEIELTAQKEIYPDEQLRVKAVIRNAGKDEIQVMKNVDGAFYGLRSVVDFRWVVKKNGQLVLRRTDVVRIDDFINTITANDLVKVPAGKEADLGADTFDNHYKITTPGKYTIELRYEFDPSAGDKIEAGLRPKLKNLTAISAEGQVEVTVLSFPLAVTAAEEKMKVAQAKQQIANTLAEAVVKNPNATAAERDAAAERLKRTTALVAEATEDYNAKMAEFRKKREEDRKKK
jgi:hypothetical protein